MSDVAHDRKPRRITVSIPCELADEIEAEGTMDDRKFGPALVRLAKEGLRARKTARESEKRGAEAR